MKLTIGKRITMGFTAVVLLTAALGGFAWAQIQAMNTNARNVVAVRVPSVATSGEINSKTRGNLSLLLMHIATNDHAKMKDCEDQLAAAKQENTELYKKYETLIDNAQERKLFDETVAARAVWSKARDHALELSNAGKKR